jgi:cobalt-zinc-cadmium efflux system membrane fusion protein
MKKMTEAPLEVEKSDEETTAGKQPSVEAIPFYKKRIGPLTWIAIAVIAAVLTVGVWVLVNHRSKAVARQQPTSDSETRPSFVTLSPEQRAAVAIEVAQRRTLQRDVTAPGKIAFNGNRVTPVFSQFAGRIARLMAEVGTTVHSGQTIGMIDTPDIVGMQTDYLQALTTERSARTTLDLATRTRERASRLAEAEAIPKRDLQQAQADESRASDDLQRAQSAIAAARGRLRSAGMSEDDINRLATTSRSVNRIVPLVAPISGTITERKAGLGQVVQPGAGDPLFMIADLSSVWVTADVYEDQLAYIHSGATVKIKTPAYPDETFLARVDQIGSTLDPDKHTVAVRCVVSNAGSRLKPGMFASMILASGTPLTVITVPAPAVISEGDQRAVFVEQAPGQYTKRAVETGNEVNGLLIINAGLKEGDRVVVRGGLLMSAGPGQ